MADIVGNTAAMVAAPARAHPIARSHHALRDLWDQSLAWTLSHYLQIGIAAIVGAILVAIMLGLRWLGRRLCRHGDINGWAFTIGRVVDRTHLWFMVLFAAKLVDGYADPPALVAQTINVGFTIAAAIQGALWVREFILGVVEHRAGGDGHSGLNSAIGIIRLLVTVVLFAIAAVAILDNLGVNVTGLVAGLGIGGIAIGLAAKGIFDDLFSALSIIFDRPFQRGDSIRWDGTSGTVEQIGLKSTRVRAVSGEEVVISNTNLLNKELHNMARLDRRRIEMVLGVAYYTPVDVVAGLPELLKGIVEAQDKCKVVRCGVSGFGASTIDVNLQFDVHSENYDQVFGARHRVSVAILRAFNEAHVDFAFPTQTAIMAGPDGRPVADAPVHDPHVRIDRAPMPERAAASQPGNADVAPA